MLCGKLVELGVSCFGIHRTLEEPQGSRLLISNGFPQKFGIGALADCRFRLKTTLHILFRRPYCIQETEVVFGMDGL
jgi:hypothetical protein